MNKLYFKMIKLWGIKVQGKWKCFKKKLPSISPLRLCNDMHVRECVFRPVDGISVVSVEVVYPLLQFVAARAALYTQGEQVDVGVQRVLIHGVYTAQIIQYKEQNGRPLGTGAVGLNTHTHTDGCL